MFQQRCRTFILIVVVLSLLLPATVSPAVAQSGPTVTVRLGGDWDTLDPHLTRTEYGYQMVYALYDRLVAIDTDGTIIPALAASWDAAPDSVKLTLRKDATCSDGTAVKPSVVAASLERMGAPETKAPYTYRVIGTDGYKVTHDDAAGTVTITTAKPFSDLLTGLAMPFASIICPAGLKDPASLQSQPAGSGPYTLEKAVRGDSYTLAARPNYTWGRKGRTTADAPSKIVFRVMESNTTAANALVTGDLDIGSVLGQDLDRVAANPDLFRLDGINFGSFFMLFNQAKGRPSADPVVRRALAMAVNREDYLKAQFFGQGKVASSYIAPQVPCFASKAEELIPKYDPKAAQKLLLDNGWTLGSDSKLTKDGKQLKLKVIGYTGQNSGPEYLAESFNAIGAASDLAVTDFDTFGGALFGTGDWDISSFPFNPPMPSPNTITGFVSGPAPDKGSNVGSVQNDTFVSERLEALKNIGDERCKHWVAAQESLVKNVDLLPLVNDIATWFGQKGFTFELYNNYQMAIDPLSIRKNS